MTLWGISALFQFRISSETNLSSIQLNFDTSVDLRFARYLVVTLKTLEKVQQFLAGNLRSNEIMMLWP